MNAITNTNAATVRNYTDVSNNRTIMGAVVTVQLGNPSDRSSYNPAARGVVVGVYKMYHNNQCVNLVNFPSEGDQGMYALCYPNNEEGAAPFYSTNARLIGEGWGKVKNMAGAIRSFGLDE